MSREKVMTFACGARRMAVALEEVEEITEVVDLKALPGLRPGVAGVILRRGRVVGVLDLARLEGTGTSTGETVVVLRGEPGLALRAEEVRLEEAGSRFPRVRGADLRRSLEAKDESRAPGGAGPGGGDGAEDPACR